MNREETRRENARKLAATCDSKTEFARIMGMEPSQVSQIIGPKPAKNIGHSIARRIEIAFAKSEGWLDVAHPEILGTYEVAPTSGDADAEGAIEQVEPTASSAELPQLQWVSEDEARILTAYRSTDDRGRELILTISESTPRVPVAPGPRWPLGR